MSKETERFDQRHIRKRRSKRCYANPGKTDCRSPGGQHQAVNTTGQVEYNHDKHYPLAPEMAIPASLSTELTLLVKSSSTNVATLPLMPMKRFTLVRTT